MKTVKMLFSIILMACHATAMALPADFVYLSDIDSTIQQDIRYYSAHNFVGKRINSYEAPRCILTRQAAEALADVQATLRAKGFSLLVYDCYRPQRAVDEFVAWSKIPLDQKNKAEFYPHVDKPDLFTQGYVAAKSGHSRGSTVDLTIVRDGKPIDMGTPYDFLDPLSHPLSSHVTGKAKENRLSLRTIMLANGFMPLSTEWWHFTLADEPFPETYFDFPVK